MADGPDSVVRRRRVDHGLRHAARRATGLSAVARLPRRRLAAYGLCHPCCGSYWRTTRAGMPATTEKLGISPPATTAPAATTTCSPMREPGSTTAPCPSHEPEPIDTGSFFHIWTPIGR